MTPRVGPPLEDVCDSRFSLSSPFRIEHDYPLTALIRLDRGFLVCFPVPKRRALARDLLPASAQPFIELDQGELLIQLRLNQAKLGGEVVGVVGEDLQIAGGAA